MIVESRSENYGSTVFNGKLLNLSHEYFDTAQYKFRGLARILPFTAQTFVPSLAPSAHPAQYNGAGQVAGVVTFLVNQEMLSYEKRNRTSFTYRYHDHRHFRNW
jgi:hypothetical protein